MTNQQIFNKVVNGLRAQKVPSYDINKGVCCYLTNNGLKCAAGQLISPYDYKRSFEGKRVIDDTSINSYFQKKGYNTGLILALQDIHDVTAVVEGPEGDEQINPNYLENLEDGFKRVANEWGLIYNAPTN